MTQNTKGKKMNIENGEKRSIKNREAVQYMFSKTSFKIMERGFNSLFCVAHYFKMTARIATECIHIFRYLHKLFLFIPFLNFNKLMNSPFKKCWRENKHTIYAEKNKQAKILQM